MHMFWVRGISAQHFEDSYRSIAKSLKLEGHADLRTDVLTLVKEWLASTPLRWMMILDNADEESIYFPLQAEIYKDTQKSSAARHLAQYLPQSTRGSILITSRDKYTALQLVGNSSQSLIEIGKLEPEDSLALIRSRLSRQTTSDTYLQSFATILGGIPLALTQACAYIEASEMMDVEEYCATFRQSETLQQRLLSNDSYDLRRDPDIPNAVFTTWKISFDYIRSRYSFASQLLSFLSFFNYQHIPKATIYHLDIEEEWLDISEALDRLVAFCLVKIEANAEFLELHPLVQAALQAWISELGELLPMLEFAIEHIRREVRGTGSSKDVHGGLSQFDLQLALASHAFVMVDRAPVMVFQGTQLIDMPDIRSPGSLADLLAWLATFSGVRSQWGLALSLQGYAVQLAALEWGFSDSRTIIFQSDLAGYLLTRNDLEAAQIVFDNNWGYLQKAANNTDTWDQARLLVAMPLHSLLGQTYGFVKAIEMQEALHSVTITANGEDYLGTLVSTTSLAWAYAREERFGEAEKLCRALLKKIDLNHCIYAKAMCILLLCLTKRDAEAERDNLIDSFMRDAGHDMRGDDCLIPESFVRLSMEGAFHTAEDERRKAILDGDLSPRKNWGSLALRVNLLSVLIAQTKSSEAYEVVNSFLESNAFLDREDESTLSSMRRLATTLPLLQQQNQSEDLLWQILEHYIDNESGTIGVVFGVKSLNAIIQSIYHRIVECERSGEKNNTYMFPIYDVISRISCLYGVGAVNPQSRLASQFDQILRLQYQRWKSYNSTFRNRVRLLTIWLSYAGRHENALELGLKWQDPRDISMLNLDLGIERIWPGRLTEATTLLESVHAQAKRLKGSKILLALWGANILANILLDDKNEASDQLANLSRRLVEHSPPNTFLVFAAWNNLASYYSKKVMCKEAADALRSTIKSVPEDLEPDSHHILRVRKHVQNFLNRHGDSPEPPHSDCQLSDVSILVDFICHELQ